VPIYGVAGEAIAINTSVYLDQTVSPPVWRKAQATALASSQAQGVALMAAVLGGPILIAGPGCVVNLSGATFVVAKTYFVSKAAAGGIAPEADYVTGNYAARLGFAQTATQLYIDPKAYLTAVP
jgi:hypothetical protein